MTGIDPSGAGSDALASGALDREASDPEASEREVSKLETSDRVAGLEAQSVEWRVGGRSIVGPVDLALERGECLGVIGPNGAGKTSLLRLLAGLELPTRGRVTLDGRRLQEWPAKARARRIGYVPQLRPVDVPLTAGQLLLSGRYPYLSARQLAPAASDFAAVDEAARRVGVTELLGRPLRELSGGERQGIYIAAALAQASEILLLDEPTTHLDAGNRRRVAALLLDLRRQAEHSLVVSTHDLRFAGRLCDRVLALQAGRPIICGSPAEVLVPEVLEALFDAPFKLLQEGGEVLPLLDLERSLDAELGLERGADPGTDLGAGTASGQDLDRQGGG
jgi:iron complex transport system ATP-binding protein